MDETEGKYTKELDKYDDKLQTKDENKEALEEKLLQKSRTTISQALGQMFGKKSGKVTTKSVACQVADDEEEEEDCAADVDETPTNSGLHTSASQVEIDIFKYGSRVKQSFNSSFAIDDPLPEKSSRKKSTTTGFKTAQ